MNSVARTMRPEGGLFIREPANPSHGMLLAAIRALMRDCGLREIHCVGTTSWIGGAVYGMAGS